jgi:hypothetical protein
VIEVAFTASVVTSDDGKILIAVFDGEAKPDARALLICTRSVAAALQKNLGSVLAPKTSE